MFTTNFLYQMVERKINQSERRCRRDDSYFQYYKTFVDDMLAKGHTKKSTSPTSLGRLSIYLIMVSSISKNLVKSEWYLTVQQKLVGNQIEIL